MYLGPNQTRPTLIEIHTADLHFGAMDPKIQYDILTEQLLNRVSGINFDIFSINGDIFEHKFMTNSDTVMYASMFINDVVNLCIKKNATLLILHGTASHDANQLKIFYHYLKDSNVDIRIVEHIGFELIKGKRILCIPEEYNMGYNYYAQYLYYSGIYDGVCMHGAITGSIYGCTEQDLDSSKAPTFSIDNFRYCRGPIMAGHVHVAGCYKEHMYYSGSPLRWKFGEEQEKGFLILLHNLETNQYCIEFEPITSFMYKTINLDDMVNRNSEEVINYLSDLRNSGIDFIKVRFTKDSNTVNTLKSYYKMNNNIIIDATDVQFQEAIRENQKTNEQYQKYDYISDSNLSPYDILTRYINENEKCEFITTEELIRTLSDI